MELNETGKDLLNATGKDLMKLSDEDIRERSRRLWDQTTEWRNKARRTKVVSIILSASVFLVGLIIMVTLHEVYGLGVIVVAAVIRMHGYLQYVHFEIGITQNNQVVTILNVASIAKEIVRCASRNDTTDTQS